MSHPKLTDHETAECAINTTCVIIAFCAILLTVGGIYTMVQFEQHARDKTVNDHDLVVTTREQKPILAAIAGALCNMDERKAKECGG